MPAVLFVCLGNICRSPAAEGVLRDMVEKQRLNETLAIESCGLGSWHTGQLPDERMREASKNRGIILKSRAKQFQKIYFERFDLILAADQSVMKDLHRFADTESQREKVLLITHFSSIYKGADIPDPYYRGDEGFEEVLDMIEDSCIGILDSFKKM